MMVFDFFLRDKDGGVASCSGYEKSFRQRKTLAARQEEVLAIQQRFPTKIPVIVERYQKERNLPRLDKTKFLVPQELTMGKFVAVIRSRMNLNARQSFYLTINNRTLASMSKNMAEIYKQHKDRDGFLYITYSSQEVFGGDYYKNNDNDLAI